MPQLTYNYISDKKGNEGQIASEYNYLRNATNNSGAVLPYGRAVVYTGVGDEIEVVSAAGQDIAGISVWSSIYEDALDAQGNSGYPDHRSVVVMARGEIFVIVETAVALADPVYFRHTANGAGKLVLGRFRNDDDAASGTVELLANARWTQAAAAGEIAKLSINLA